MMRLNYIKAKQKKRILSIVKTKKISNQSTTFILL